MPSLSPGRDTWAAWRHYIIKEVERLSLAVEALREQIAIGDARGSNELEAAAKDLAKQIEALAREFREMVSEFKEEEFAALRLKLELLQLRTGIWAAIIAAVVSIGATALAAAVALKFIHP